LELKLKNIKDEFNKLNELKLENINLKREIDDKIENYKTMINTKIKCLNCDQNLYVENLINKDT